MWMNFSRAKVIPENVAMLVEILSREDSLTPMRNAAGFQANYLVESTDRPGEVISITLWQSAEDGQAYLASPACRAVIETIQEYLIQPLERSYYTVHIQESSPDTRLKGHEMKKVFVS